MFWCNHFTVSTAATNNVLFYGPHIRALRACMTGSFTAMAQAAVLNPAMSLYLDNARSKGPHSQAGLKGYGTLNENLGREIMELHTMSSAGGYSQADVTQAALALTGWRFFSGDHTDPGHPPAGVKPGIFFDAFSHEPGSRSILGRSYGYQKRRPRSGA